MDFRKSEALFSKAIKLIPGGVNSPVRAFRSVGGHPVFIRKSSGSRLWDEDGNEYLDYVGSWGPMLLGHAYPPVIEAVREAAVNGTSFGAATEREIEMAERVCSVVPSIEMVRMVNSGTEATMSAIRLARAFTKKNKIIKFDGCYHGHADSFLIRAGSGAATLGIPDSPGVTPEIVANTLVADFNDVESVKSLIQANYNEVAAVIVEPVVGNMGCIPPRGNFLQDLRKLCDQEKILLIFDEVMTGFRVSIGGAQQLYNVWPDLTTLGKIIGGGLPVGAFGGKKEIMGMIAPSGPVYQAGTLSGNPLAMAAGNTMLRTLIENPGIYDELENKGSKLEKDIRQFIDQNGFPVTINRVGSMLTMFFTSRQVNNALDARSCNTHLFGHHFHNLLNEGIYMPPSQFEAAFLSAAHTDTDLENTFAGIKRSLKKIFC